MEKQFLQDAIIKDQAPEQISILGGFLQRMGLSDTIPEDYDVQNYISNILRGLLEVVHVGRGRSSFLLRVKPVVTNVYGGLHGGAVASVAEMVAVDCARTVVGKDKELFLGESSNSYLSSAPRDSEVVVDASVVRSGRNLTVVAVEFKLKESDKLVYTSRATFYNMPVASL
ncbi:uncharacterized protein LOC141693699 [Apium graveolens]|uniref:uncharacterized protein LOC141693699 n=1 Tax=Apium graveolens TaxID=4045 RepID=UPI003D78CEC5